MVAVEKLVCSEESGFLGIEAVCTSNVRFVKVQILYDICYQSSENDGERIGVNALKLMKTGILIRAVEDFLESEGYYKCNPWKNTEIFRGKEWYAKAWFYV